VRKERKAQLVTAGVLAAVIAGVMIGRSGWRPRGIGYLLPSRVARAEPTPQDVIYGMLDAARQGDVRKYLRAYTGQMEASLRQAIAESTEEGFAKYLRESNAAIKGIAITEPQPLTEREVRVRVEYVYQDRNEVQHMHLEKVAGDWRIARMEAAERIKTLVPYGTPVE